MSCRSSNCDRSYTTSSSHCITVAIAVTVSAHRTVVVELNLLRCPQRRYLPTGQGPCNPCSHIHISYIHTYIHTSGWDRSTFCRLQATRRFVSTSLRHEAVSIIRYLTSVCMYVCMHEWRKCIFCVCIRKFYNSYFIYIRRIRT